MEDIAFIIVCFIIAVLFTFLICGCIFETYVEKKVKLLKEENEKLKNMCAFLTIKLANLFSENEKLNKKIKRK